MPSPVDDYFKKVQKDNPSYSDEQAWATAWSIYCKHASPGSDHCQKPTSEYFSDKSAKEFSSPDALKKYLQDHPKADKSKHQVKKDEGPKKPKEKKNSPHSLRDKAEEHTKAGKHDEAALHYMGAAQRFRDEGSHGAAKAMDDAARESVKKHYKSKKEASSDLNLRVAMRFQVACGGGCACNAAPPLAGDITALEASLGFAERVVARFQGSALIAGLPGTRDVAQRIVNAENDFIEVLMQHGGISKKDAEAVYQHYRKLKLVKMDAVGGRISVKHGAYLDRDVILKALAQV